MNPLARLPAPRGLAPVGASQDSEHVLVGRGAEPAGQDACLQVHRREARREEGHGGRDPRAVPVQLHVRPRGEPSVAVAPGHERQREDGDAAGDHECGRQQGGEHEVPQAVVELLP